MQYNQFNALSDCIEIDLKNNYTYINDSMFFGFKNLEIIHNTKNLLSIDQCTFDTCNNLKQILLDKNLEYIGHNAFDETSISCIVIPPKIRIINAETFIYCKNLHHISFDANSQLEMIDNSAFSYCSSLLSIMLPESLKKINEYAFSNCYQLGKILIPHSIEKIGHFAFSNCYKLSSVVFY